MVEKHAVVQQPSPRDAPPLGADESLQGIVRRYCASIYRFALSMCDDASLALEITKETFLAVHGHAAQMPNDMPLQRVQGPSWTTLIYGAAANACVRCAKQAKSISQGTALALDAPSPAIGHGGTDPIWQPGPWCHEASESLLSGGLEDLLQRSMRVLPSKYRAVILLCDSEGLNYEEVALCLGLTVPTVKARVHRARMQVRQTINEYFKAKA